LHTVRYAGVLAASSPLRPKIAPKPPTEEPAMGEPTELPRRSPPRGPPYWRSRVLRRQALGDEDDAQGRCVQETA
jgi:hypothetical protein